MTFDLNENQFRLTLENAPIPAFAHDQAGNLRFLNEEFIAVTGYSREDLPSFRALIERACADAGRAEDLLAAARESFGPDAKPCVLAKIGVRLASGERRVWSLRNYSIGQDSHGVLVNLCMALDITQADAAETALREAELRMRMVAEIGGIGAFEHDHLAHVIRADERVRALFGMEPNPEVPEAEFFSAVHPDDLPELAAAYEGVCVAGDTTPQHKIFRVVNKIDGKTRVVDMRVRLFVENGRPLRCLGAISDITEERAARQALAESEARLRLATESGGVGAFEADLIGERIVWDERTRAIWGYGPDEAATSDDFFAAVHPDDKDRLREALREASEGGDEARCDADYRIVNKKDGSIRVVSTRGRLVMQDGRPARVIGVATDVTESRAAEKALRDSEARARLATEIGEIGAFEAEHVHRNVFCDARVREIWGYGPEEPMTGEDFVAGIHADDRQKALELYLGVCKSGYEGTTRTEFRVVNRKTGQVRLLDVRGRVLFENGKAVRSIGALTDVTEARAAEKALRESEARARLAVEIGEIATFEADIISPRLVWDSRARELFGIGPDEPASPFDFLSGIHPDDRARTFALFERACRPDGDHRCEAEFRIVNRRSGETRMVRGQGRVFFENGKPARILGAITDITAERDASIELERQVEARTRELAEAQTRLAQAQRMEALGHLAGGIAHDFNNVLQAIEAATDLIERKPEPENLPRYLRMLREGTKRGSAVSRRLSSLSRRPELEPETVPTAQLVEEIAGVLRRTVDPGVEVEAEVAPDCPSLLADRRQLETALINIAANAREAMRGGGKLRLSARAETAQSAAAPPYEAKLRLGTYVRLEIADSGHGMTPDVRARATEPFFSTKPRGQGVGLGLSMARGFAEQSGGALELVSAPGEGTTVALWLPVAAPLAAEPPAADLAARGRLLLVDDDPLIRELVSEQLREAGYSVTECEEGRAALQHLDSGLSVDLLLTDFAMPEMNGVTLAHEARRRRPRLPVIVLTGYASEAADAAGETDFSLLRKPIDSAALVGRVAELIAKT